MLTNLFFSIFNNIKNFITNLSSTVEVSYANDFEIHRTATLSVFNKIKSIKWIDVDVEKYKILEKEFNPSNSDILQDLPTFLPPPSLSSSRYCHRSYDKCFPNSKSCYECYKYWCPCCEQGTNCMYGENCKNLRCIRTLNKYYSDIFNIENGSRRVFVYDEPEVNFFKEHVFCSIEIYGY